MSLSVVLSLGKPRPTMVGWAVEYQIGDFSLISRIPVKTLRYYHEVGLLEPSRTDAQSGYRFYANEQLERARLIKLLRSLEFPIKSVRSIIERRDAGEPIEEIVAKQREEIRHRLDDLLRLERKLSTWERPAPRAGQVSVRHLEPELFATVRFTGAYPDVGYRFGELMGAAGDLATGPAAALYWQAEYAETDADISVAVPIARPAERPGAEVVLLQGSDADATVHRGPFETIGAGYERVLTEVARRSVEIVLPIRERYLKGPGDADSPSPEEFLTEIIVPFRAASRSPEPSG